ncbi:ribosome silencing factor [Thiohalorhabdus methylotrophus]|uniref:Ribosomal silencing factor RsfS n=1 Tax=Thiohalorhabdus methylotrophus TaxID=3242694 RepID=A0ABV4TSW2_9GAMM
MASIAKNRKPTANKEEADRMLEIIQTVLDDRKAKDVQTLDVSERSGFADYFVIATGTSDRHVGSIADHLQEEVKHAGFQPNGIEGAESGDWILLDLGGVIVHVMRAETRAFYNLEELWTDILSGEPDSGSGPASEH